MSQKFIKVFKAVRSEKSLISVSVFYEKLMKVSPLFLSQFLKGLRYETYQMFCLSFCLQIQRVCLKYNKWNLFIVFQNYFLFNLQTEKYEKYIIFSLFAIKHSHCNFTRLQVENATRTKSNFSDEVWYAEIEREQAVYFNICRQISTYKSFLERNIEVVISNASCVPKTSFNENKPQNVMNVIKEKENNR